MKIAAVIVFSFILGGATAYSFVRSSAHNGQPPTVSFHANAANNKLSDLLTENTKLKNKIFLLEAVNQKLLAEARIQTLPSPALASLRDETPELSHDFAEEVRKQRIAEEAGKGFAEYLSSFKSTSPEEINRDLEKKFETEAIDYPWADNHEKKLQYLFVTNENLSKFVPESVTCKATRCQIKIPISNIEESNQVMEGISKALADTYPGSRQPMIVTLPDPSTGFVDFYVARDGDVRLYQ